MKNRRIAMFGPVCALGVLVIMALGSSSVLGQEPAPAAPDTSITSGPAEGSSTLVTTGDFTYASVPAMPGDHFECKLDAASFTACPVFGISYTALALGAHTFAVRAIDALGNVDASPALRTWNVIDASSAADIAVSSIVGAPTAARTTNSGYVATVVNNGPVAATAATVTLPLPKTAKLVSVKGPLGACPAGVCQLGTLAPGAVARATIVLRWPAAGGDGIVSATATSSTPDAVTTNNSASFTARLVALTRVTRLTASPRAFTVRRNGRGGTKLIYRLNRPGRVAIQIRGPVRSICLPRRGRHCLRVRANALTVTVPLVLSGAGPNIFGLTGTRRGVALPPGPYRVSVTPRGGRGASIRVSIRARG